MLSESDEAQSTNNAQRPSTSAPARTPHKTKNPPTEDRPETKVETTQHQTPIRCAQINLQRAEAASTQAIQHAIHHNLDFLLIQEPYCREGQVASFPLAWKIFQRKSTAEKAPRAAIACCNPTWTPFLVSMERDFVSVLVIFNNQQFILSTVYSSPSDDLTDATTAYNHVRLKCLTVPHIIGGDFNAHNVIWGYRDTTPKGHEMENFMANNNLHLHNSPGAQPTFDNSYHKGWPDLTLLTSDIVNNIYSWTVMDDESNSDHKYIHFLI
ncbi:uncharacterized protein LOC118193330 [Stegodyphus dumicola]|uniref:uncharacterized protein LOC118193330 n=1 Tax=Stegodyphus dumicola TaxID=202533 RepID=UPI0015AA2461|nr:uncharacterized protein LOC118193330 [Stegodyphus dumicola]